MTTVFIQEPTIRPEFYFLKFSCLAGLEDSDAKTGSDLNV